MIETPEAFPGDEAIAAVAHCAGVVQHIVDTRDEYARLRGREPVVCAVTRLGANSPAYRILPGDERKLRASIARGHTLLYLVGVIAEPGASGPSLQDFVETPTSWCEAQSSFVHDVARRFGLNALRKAHARAAR